MFRVSNTALLPVPVKSSRKLPKSRNKRKRKSQKAEHTNVCSITDDSSPLLINDLVQREEYVPCLFVDVSWLGRCCLEGVGWWLDEPCSYDCIEWWRVDSGWRFIYVGIIGNFIRWNIFSFRSSCYIPVICSYRLATRSRQVAGLLSEYQEDRTIRYINIVA